MKVKNKQTNEVVEATKNPDNTYTVQGNTLSKEDMGKAYMMVKVAPKKEDTDNSSLENMVTTNSWQSETLNSLGLALSKAQGEFGSIDKSTAAYNYKYATLADTLDMVRPILAKYEIALISMNVSQVLNGVLMTGVKTMLLHDGEYIASESYLPTKETKSNNIAQVQGSWQSYQRRYNIMSMLNLATEDKDAKV
jgi:hypothetical protein